MHDTAVTSDGTADTGPAALSVPQAAAQLNVSVRIAWLMVKNGELRSYKTGKLRRIPADEIPAYIARRIEAERAA